MFSCDAEKWRLPFSVMGYDHIRENETISLSVVVLGRGKEGSWNLAGLYASSEFILEIPLKQG